MSEEIKPGEDVEQSTEAVAEEVPPVSDVSTEEATAAASETPTAGSDLSDEELETNIVEMIKTVYDPEIPVNVYDLGLIYAIRINPDRTVNIRMTLTAPNCPAAGFLPGQVEQRVRTMDEVTDAEVELTFDPPYHPDMMSEEAKLELGFL
ncbi:MAG: DUF59 domain-containing protein [Rhodothermales bacterium]|nr:DUF59 domain-containing protein [Rhodothermales bacterium]MBO6781248.1 DUF59 domain-containing protein [Rhodothermales bacterium]